LWEDRRGPTAGASENPATEQIVHSIPGIHRNFAPPNEILHRSPRKSICESLQKAWDKQDFRLFMSARREVGTTRSGQQIFVHQHLRRQEICPSYETDPTSVGGFRSGPRPPPTRVGSVQSNSLSSVFFASLP
jgi:hypothetical protein